MIPGGHARLNSERVYGMLKTIVLAILAWLPLLAAASMDLHADLVISLAPPVGVASSVLGAMADYAMAVAAIE